MTRFLSIVWLLIATTLLNANASPPWRSGTLALEPQGVKDVAIVREKLHFDLKPLMDGKPVNVEATYQLKNSGSARSVELVFITGMNEVASAQCWLGDKLLTSVIEKAGDMPKEWQHPKTTPHPSGNDALSVPFQAQSASTTKWIRFTVPLLPGEQTLKVRYQVQASAYVRSHEPARFWQVAYIFAPAKSWQSFGGLNMTIEVPAGWNIATTLPMKRTGDVLTGSWDALPADNFALTTQFPMSEDRIKSDLLEHIIALVILVGAIVGSVLLCWKLGEHLAKQQRSSWRGILRSAGLSILLALLAVVYLSCFVITRYFQTIDLPSSQSNWQNSYGTANALFFLGIPVLFMAFVGSFVFLQFMVWRSHATHTIKVQ